MLEAALQQFTWEVGPSAPLQLGPGICNRLAQAAGQACAVMRHRSAITCVQRWYKLPGAAVGQLQGLDMAHVQLGAGLDLAFRACGLQLGAV